MGVTVITAHSPVIPALQLEYVTVAPASSRNQDQRFTEWLELEETLNI